MQQESKLYDSAWNFLFLSMFRFESAEMSCLPLIRLQQAYRTEPKESKHVNFHYLPFYYCCLLSEATTDTSPRAI
jgi:hypothetical protein